MKKLLNKKGFTLMEMMIVIAIIVILVAIAVPNFNSSLESANKATDAANLNAAEKAGAVYAVDENNHGETYYYDFSAGDLAVGTTTSDKTDMGSCENHTSCFIKVEISDTGVVTATWSDGTTNCEPTTDAD